MPPGAIEPESKAPVSDVTVCETVSRFVQQTVVPTGQRQTVGMVKVDLNVSEKNRAYFRWTDDYKRFPNVGGTSPGAAAPLETLETRQQVVEGPMGLSAAEVGESWKCRLGQMQAAPVENTHAIIANDG